MDGDQAVAARRRAHEPRTEVRLELIEAAAQREQRRVHRRVRRVVAEQAGLDEVARGGRLRALREEQDERGLLLCQPDLHRSELDPAASRIELETAEPIVA